MKIGVPKEVKNRENRVAVVPGGVKVLVDNGHQVYIEKNAGVGAGIPDEKFIAAGAKILDTADDVWQTADMIMKVKEPIEPEYGLIKAEQLLFTYFHFASYEPLTTAID